jgi:hypothetical protein
MQRLVFAVETTGLALGAAFVDEAWSGKTQAASAAAAPPTVA